MTITCFEDLIAWQKARALTREIYRLTRTAPFGQDRALASQMQRAAVSIMSNIAEGFERNTEGDYHRFLTIAKGSCGEIRAQLYVALDAGYIAEKEFRNLQTASAELGRVIGGLMRTVAAQRSLKHKGSSATPSLPDTNSGSRSTARNS